MKIREFANKTVRHSDPLPKLSKPTTGREQEHPYTGMLVGSKYSEDQDTGMYNPKQKANQTYYKMQKFLDLALDAGFDQIKDIQNPQTFDMLVSRLAQTGVDLTDSIETAGEPITEEQFDQLAEKQDACYHKVKSRYDVWPSAYASGALVKCRKVGAKNWGNSSKKKKSKKK